LFIYIGVYSSCRMLYISNIDTYVKQGSLETLLLILGFTLAAIYAMAIGGNDTANSVASPFGGGVASYNKLLLIFTISVFLGAILQGHMVIKTLGKGVVSDLDLYATFCNSFGFHMGLHGLVLFFCYYYCVYFFTV